MGIPGLLALAQMLLRGEWTVSNQEGPAPPMVAKGWCPGIELWNSPALGKSIWLYLVHQETQSKVLLAWGLGSRMSFVEPYLSNTLSVVGKKSKKQAAFHPGQVQPPSGEGSPLHFLGMKSPMVI